MPQENTGAEADSQLLMEARSQGTTATLRAYFKLSGPGWMQSALTLGGGSLAGSLYLGVLGGKFFFSVRLLCFRSRHPFA